MIVLIMIMIRLWLMIVTVSDKRDTLITMTMRIMITI